MCKFFIASFLRTRSNASSSSELTCIDKKVKGMLCCFHGSERSSLSIERKWKTPFLLSLSTICIDKDKETGTVERKKYSSDWKGREEGGGRVCANIVFILPTARRRRKWNWGQDSFGILVLFVPPVAYQVPSLERLPGSLRESGMTAISVYFNLELRKQEVTPSVSQSHSRAIFLHSVIYFLQVKVAHTYTHLRSM